MQYESRNVDNYRCVYCYQWSVNVMCDTDGYITCPKCAYRFYAPFSHKIGTDVNRHNTTYSSTNNDCDGQDSQEN